MKKCPAVEIMQITPAMPFCEPAVSADAEIDPEIVYMESDEASGASLRVRGNRAVLASPRVTWRVIPACAGTVLPLRRWSQRHRVIPACAGNSELGVELPCVLAGHPCVCGEQVEPAMFERPSTGHPCVCGEQTV